MYRRVLFSLSLRLSLRGGAPEAPGRWPVPGRDRPAGSAVYRIRLGSQSEMMGKAMRMPSLTTSATMNGSTP
jgi:hypothetical protein